MTQIENHAHSHTQASPLARDRTAARGGTSTTTTNVTDTSRPRIRGPLFPLSYREGFSQWWASVPPRLAEATVLSFLPFNNLPLPTKPNPTPVTKDADPYGRVCSSTLVPLSSPNHLINEFCISHLPTTAATTNKPPQTLVILHGYGAGLGFFYRNYDSLSHPPNWTLYSLDLLGMGNSSRPPFRIHATTKQGKIQEAENFFIDALEEWRIKRGIEKFTLMGHSLGGYLATCYALKYPGRLKKLILASPVGIPEDPWAEKEAPLPENPPRDQSHPPPPDAALQTELLVEPPTATNGKAISSPPTPEPHTKPSTSSVSLPATAPSTPTSTPAPKPRRPIPAWVVYLWDRNLSPFALVRWAGPLGPLLVSGWTSRRFNTLPPAESSALHTYAYSLFRQRGSGEYALAYILAPGAFARNPLVHRIGKVGVPTVLMYGEVDWMDVAGGYAAEEVIRQQGVRRDSEGWVGGNEWRGEERVRKEMRERKGEPKDGEAGAGEAKVLVVKAAGHHLYLDNAEDFNEMIRAEMEDVERRDEMKKVWKERSSEA